MTDTQFLVLLGTVWITPHLNKWHALTTGNIFLCVAALKGLGWV